ncbi:MAG: ABC-F family ATP-binding cassette domain-containing protein [Clostridia bacterium]|nr:ABC-F family ATP-binding cassette domain-containing protein [Clostridia bacterium]
MRANVYIRVENVTVAFGERTLFHIDSLSIHEGERLGLVGMNGSGKTTLLRLLGGELTPDEGRIRCLCQPFYFRQMPEAVSHEGCSDPMTLSLFGVQHVAGQRVVSGGENTRLRLAEVFSADRAFVLLDEPSSNLDAAGLAYLSRRLDMLETFVLVSHDRDLLNRHCTRILEIENGCVTVYDGHYDAYVQQKQQARQRAMTEYEQYTDEMSRLRQVYAEKRAKARQLDRKPRGISNSEAKVREFTSSHRSPASKAQMLERSARNIQRRMEHMEVREKPRETPKIRPDFTLTDPPRNPIILEAEHLNYAYPNGRAIFRDATFRLQRGSRTALLGENGAGKTTLLRLIEEGQLIRRVPKARLGCFHQDMSDLDEEITVLESIMEVSIQKESVARTILNRLLFPAQDIHKPVHVLSGGERIRLCFARLFVGPANVLILDEPTNYLDIPSVEALQALFAEYEGTLLFVSHDAAFTRAVATHRLQIRDGQIIPLD